MCQALFRNNSFCLTVNAIKASLSLEKELVFLRLAGRSNGLSDNTGYQCKRCCRFVGMCVCVHL